MIGPSFDLLHSWPLHICPWFSPHFARLVLGLRVLSHSLLCTYQLQMFSVLTMSIHQIYEASSIYASVSDAPHVSCQLSFLTMCK